MTEKQQVPKKAFTADWLMRGALVRIGDAFDRLTGRKWIPSSSLATSELILKIKALLDSEAKEIPGKGKVVPHNIELKVQWDKFSTDSEEAVKKLETELLIATADHINDSLYFTLAPLNLIVKPDYFIDGVKLFVGFEKFSENKTMMEMNVTVPAMNMRQTLVDDAVPVVPQVETYVVKFAVRGVPREKRLQLPVGGRVSVGRTGTNDIVIDDASVSKIHASLVATAEHFLAVADTGSTNGTFVNGQRIAYGKAVVVSQGSVLKFGDIQVNVEYIPPATAAEAQPEEKDPYETVKINEFEFTSRPSSPETVDAAAPKTVGIDPDTLKTSANSDQTHGGSAK